jgi:hypothetical protein
MGYCGCLAELSYSGYAGLFILSVKRIIFTFEVKIRLWGLQPAI